MRKRRLLAVVIAAAMLGVGLTGCGRTTEDCVKKNSSGLFGGGFHGGGFGGYHGSFGGYHGGFEEPHVSSPIHIPFIWGGHSSGSGAHC